MSSLTMLAQSQLVVTSTNGSEEKFALDSKPSVIFDVREGHVGVSVGDSYKELDIKSLKLENIPAESNQMVVLDVDGKKVVVPLSQLKSIVATSFNEGANHLPKAIAEDASVSIYNAALVTTHLTDSLMRYMDVSYGFATPQDVQDSCTWTNNALCVNVSMEYDNVAYPEYRYYKYTALLVPDAVLKEKYGINNLDDLRAKAHELYDPVYPEDTDVTDETDRRNALNRFISYHLLPFYGEYYKLTAFDNGRLQYNFNREKADITDWYETMMPYSIMKFSFPSGTDAGLYVNRRGVQSGQDDRGGFVRGAKVTAEIEAHTAANGIYHYIDDIVAYDRTMQDVVCYDRMRLDCTTLSPDFMTSGARGHSTRVAEDEGKYGLGGQGFNALNNTNTCVGFKNGWIQNFEQAPTTVDMPEGSYTYRGNDHIHVRNRVLNFWSYQGDEVTLMGMGMGFNQKIKLPSLPAGKYELRLATVVGFANRGTLNFYIDEKQVGDHVDFRLSGSNPISPYVYMTEQTWGANGRVTRIYPQSQDLVWVDLNLLADIQNSMMVGDQTGWGISPLWSAPIKEAYAEDGEEISDAELIEMFKDEVIYKLFKKDDQSLYRNALYYWRQAQNNPTQFVFEGNEPLDPNSDGMKAYYDNLIDWVAFFKMGPVRYFDKVLHDRGWMRGAGDYSPGNRTAYDAAESTTMRSLSNTRRYVIGTFETDGKSDHYLRLQQMHVDGREMPLDYIELIPVSLIETENIY